MQRFHNKNNPTEILNFYIILVLLLYYLVSILLYEVN